MAARTFAGLTGRTDELIAMIERTPAEFEPAVLQGRMRKLRAEMRSRYRHDGDGIKADVEALDGRLVESWNRAVDRIEAADVAEDSVLGFALGLGG